MFPHCVSEVLNLKPEHINKSMMQLLIKQAKGKKDRNVPIPKPILRDLKYIPIKIKRRALQHAISKISLKVLSKRIHFHTLRHSGATFYMFEKGLDIREVQQLLGHSRITTTQIYTHVNPKKLQDKFKEIWN